MYQISYNFQYLYKPIVIYYSIPGYTISIKRCIPSINIPQVHTYICTPT